MLLLMKILNKGIKLPSKKKEIDCHDIIDYWPKIIREGTNWLSFLNIMEYTTDRIENETTLLTPLLNMFSMFHICCWYNKWHDDQNKVEYIAIRCSSCGKQTGLSMDDMNTKYKDTTTSFVLNTVLHHVGMSWIIGKKIGIWYGKT